MKKRRLAALAVAVIVVALMLEAGILKYVNDRTTYRTSEVMLDRVLTVLEKNDQSEADLIESLKSDYIVRARAVSYILDAKPAAELDVDELQRIAKLISVDEIHLLDQTGMIYSGTLPKYFGYNFDTGEQMAYFKPMLTDKQRSMCQDVTPNTAEGKEMMYAIVWDERGTKMVQVGITPKHLLAEVMKEKYEKEKLLYTSMTDELTRCGNRHAYETDIAKLDLQDAWAYLSLDVNGLKQVNDTRGHAAGDELICAAAEAMKRSFADVGRVYRIGGDEFVVIVTGELGALDARLQDFDADVVRWRGELVDTMRIAWGYVLSTERSWESVHEISKAADKRMYERKAYFYRESGTDRRKS